MSLPTKGEFDELRERYTERWALDVCRSATFIECPRKFAIASTITITTPRGRSLPITASDIYAARHRFFSALTLDLERDGCHMTTVGDTLVDLYQDWLRREYSPLYRYDVSDDNLKWLKLDTILVVARYLKGEKYTLYTTQGRQAFMDAWACSEMCRLQLLTSLTGELARLVHHIMGDPGQRQVLIDQFHRDLDDRLRNQTFSQPEPLPPLPEGASLPFALLSQVAFDEETRR